MEAGVSSVGLEPSSFSQSWRGRKFRVSWPSHVAGSSPHGNGGSKTGWWGVRGPPGWLYPFGEGYRGELKAFFTSRSRLEGVGKGFPRGWEKRFFPGGGAGPINGGVKGTVRINGVFPGGTITGIEFDRE